MKSMKIYPFVSVVVVSYNRKEWLEKILPPIRDLNYPKDRFEVLVVDNNSTDGSVEYLKKLKWVRLVRMDKNYGASIGKNVGIEKTKGDYIYFVDSDVILKKNSLMELVRVAESDEKIGICGSKIIDMDGDEVVSMSGGDFLNIFGVLIHRGMKKRNLKDLEKMEDVFSFPSCSILIRRKPIEKLKYYFDTSYFIYYEDIDFCWRVGLLGNRLVYVPNSIACHRTDKHGKDINPLTIYRTYRNKLWSFRKNFRFPIKQIMLLNVSLTILAGILYWTFKGKWKYGISVFRYLFDSVNEDVDLSKVPLKRQIGLLSLKF
jgi:GT2 family glycosyltransferase